MRRSRWFRVAGAALLLAGVALQLAGIEWGLLAGLLGATLLIIPPTRDARGRRRK